MFTTGYRVMEEGSPIAVLSTQGAIVCSQQAGLAVYRLGRGQPLLLMPILLLRPAYHRRAVAGQTKR
jgi:hypothetical protein